MLFKRILDMFSRNTASADESQWILTDRTQIEPSKSGDSPIQLVVGLDFGTSFTKVVVGESRIHYAVPFGKISLGKNPYLLPSAVSIVGRGDECMLGVCGDATQVFDNLKMPLIDRNFGEQAQGRAVVFLALVLRYVRGWFFNTHGQTYKNREIHWFMNIGLPTDSYDDKDLTNVYRNIVHAAWRSSVVRGPISLKRSIDYLSVGDSRVKRLPAEFSDRFLQDDRINVFPEFAAQLTGYTRSPRHQKDLHAMIDVGGGTFDVTVFNVIQRQGEDLFPIFARTVRPLGPRYLVRHRFGALGLPDTDEISPFDDLPDDKEFADLCRVSVGLLAEVDKPFQRKIRECIGNAVLYTKQNRHPDSRHWKSGLPTFFCGGATSSEFYLRLLAIFKEERCPFRLLSTDLPQPEDLETPLLDGASYNRLVVAYGLSFDPFDIGGIIQRNDIDDMKPAPPIDYTDRYISKNMV